MPVHTFLKIQKSFILRTVCLIAVITFGSYCIVSPFVPLGIGPGVSFLFICQKSLLGLMHYCSKINKEIYIDVEMVFCLELPYMNLCQNFVWFTVETAFKKVADRIRIVQSNIYRYATKKPQIFRRAKTGSRESQSNLLPYFKTHMLPTVQWVKWLWVCCWLTLMKNGLQYFWAQIHDINVKGNEESGSDQQCSYHGFTWN